MRRGIVISVGFVLLVAGCSARSSYYWADDAGADGASSVVAGDGGASRDGSSRATAEDGGGGETSRDGGKRDATTTRPDICTPGSIAGFYPSWTPPAPIRQNRCTPTAVQTVIDCLFEGGSTSPTICDALLTNSANDDCIACIVSDEVASVHGPIIVNNDTARLNLSGCVAALSGDKTASGCGAKVAAASQCRETACAACPDPFSSAAAADDYEQCVLDAEDTSCESYVSAASCADVLLYGTAAECADGTTFLQLATSISRVFCAGP